MRVCLLSRSAIADDPRVRRQGDCLAAAGHDVIAAGLDGSASSTTPGWPIETFSWSPPAGAERVRLIGQLLAARLGDRATDRAVAANANFKLLTNTIDIAADLYLANDWPMLPLARELARRYRGRYAYDAHEYAAQEWTRLRWRVFWPPLIRRLEALAMEEAHFVSTVSQPLAEQMHVDNGRGRMPLVIRSVPPYQSAGLRQTGETIVVLYHGILMPGRGLETLIESVPAWPVEMRLVLRGPGSPDYLRQLRKHAESLRHRVSFEPPVPMTSLVSAARTADIGIFTPPGSGPHMEFALPNKLFEYVMAGLAVVVSPRLAMRDLVGETGVGLVAAGDAAADIAETMQQMTASRIDQFKAASIEAATTLCWEVEQQRLLEAVAQ